MCTVFWDMTACSVVPVYKTTQCHIQHPKNPTLCVYNVISFSIMSLRILISQKSFRSIHILFHCKKYVHFLHFFLSSCIMITACCVYIMQYCNLHIMYSASVFKYKISEYLYLLFVKWLNSVYTYYIYVEIKCQLDATDDFYCRSYCLLNMFQTPLCPSSGAREYYTGGCCHTDNLKTKAPNTTGQQPSVKYSRAPDDGHNGV